MTQTTLPIPSLGLASRITLATSGEDALSLANLALKLKANKPSQPLVIITANAFDAQRLLEEIPYFAPSLSVHLLPDWETLPYDQFSPHPDLISERLTTLYHIAHNACDVIIVPLATALIRLSPKAYLNANTFMLKKGQKLDLEALRRQCAEAGYHHVTQVISHGEFSVRGGLVDLFPMGSALPYRLDLFDDEIETIRTFDVDTQRSLYPVPEIRLLPAREFPLDETGITLFRSQFREAFEGDPQRAKIYKDVSKGVASGGIEWYLPLFFEQTATLLDYLPANSLLCLHGDLDQSAQQFWREAQSRYRTLAHDAERPLLVPEKLLIKTEDFFSTTHAFARVTLTISKSANNLPALDIERRAENPLHKLTNFISQFKGRILIVAESLGRRATMTQLFAEHGLNVSTCETWAEFQASVAHVMLGVSSLHTGVALTDSTPNLAIITEAELYAATVRQQRRREKEKSRSTEGMLKDLSELRINDPVVHEQHGVGRYKGLINLDFGEGETEFLLLEYFGDDKLYVPVSQLFLISRYSGGPPESAPLHRLGSGNWEKAKKKALKQIRDTAAELLNLYAQRAARRGHAFTLSLHDYEAFCEGFPFEETPDQLEAIENVIKDMQSGRPMDRLVCGDVGFGKTEVALRAAFVAVMGGRQVAVLVPTTLLAEQHFNNFKDRFAEWPIKIAEISRFRTAKEQKEALAGLDAGQIDIIIGTHRLIQKDVKFKNLGLVVLDEEHRFGVRQKEQLKALRAEVDVLTLTATPIPRTLSMAMEGLREFSIITTPPQKRLSIKTFHTDYSEGIIREAAMREFKRGGQVYFLHNEVDTIHSMREKLERILPDARIAVAHGQLRERELEHVMRDFYHQRYNLLLCTTIIETGIDVPTANTIIMNKADMFGLAQMHQLRGRVGRSHHQAYAYLLTDPDRKITPQAQKRLDAIQLMEDLGAGFHLAMHDLEIRGAGELLGDSQSGEMQEIGFHLYSDMLNHAVKQLKAGKEPDLNAPLSVTTEINLHTPALLTNAYCPDVHERLVIYKRLANCVEDDDLDNLQEELIDRFGLLPEQGEALIACHRLRIAAKPLGIIKIDASDTAIQLQFNPKADIDPMKLINLLQRDRRCRMNGPDKLRVTVGLEAINHRADFVKTLLKEFI
ncbi:MAG: transcription-repair coupling factor [Methylotenera sp.]|nr:transcription-repair coupling factor [Methylotenera sp.]MDO9232534.1 transcription-repair coupling factor [Methylotenera sp.]MDP2101755.1 transcription-repair coupling factor [Methylotenera sp.]MDP2281978.1 transcription-repair coupling factor [Methylotenera sp.]MDP2403555.1 transcription-repair coupling factor [Methylotenera sp.]